MKHEKGIEKMLADANRDSIKLSMTGFLASLKQIREQFTQFGKRGFENLSKKGMAIMDKTQDELFELIQDELELPEKEVSDEKVPEKPKTKPKGKKK